MFVFTQLCNTILDQIWTKQRRIACKLPTCVDAKDRVVSFAQYSRSKSWPFGRVIKNSTGFHGECMIVNKPALVYLGQTSAEAEQAMTILKEQHTYMRLNKGFQ